MWNTKVTAPTRSKRPAWDCQERALLLPRKSCTAAAAKSSTNITARSPKHMRRTDRRGMPTRPVVSTYKESRQKAEKAKSRMPPTSLALMPLSFRVPDFPLTSSPLPFQVLRGGVKPYLPSYLSLFPQLLHFRDEAVHILELAVHGGKTHIGNIIDLPQLVHDQFANIGGSDLPVQPGPHLPFHLIHCLLDGLRGDGPFLAGTEYAVENLGAGEGLPPAILFYHEKGHFIDAFVCSKTPVTGGAFPAAPDGTSLFCLPRVQNLAIRVQSQRAAHLRRLQFVRPLF